MQRSIVIFALGWLGLTALTTQPSTPASASITTSYASETRELRAHFDSVDGELTSADISRLSPDQSRRRRQLVRWLRAYGEAGEFPRNGGISNDKVPIFRDRRRVLCAMAYLIARSGRTDIVDRIASSRNLAYIPQLVDDTALVSWLDAHGVTVAEAARIQPSYGNTGPTADNKIETKFLWVSVGLIGVDATATAFSVTKPSQLPVIVALLGGVGALAVGSSHLGDDGNSRTLARVTTAVGGVTTAVGLWRSLAPHDWYRPGPLHRALAVLANVRATPVQLPSGVVVPGVGWGIAYR